MGYPPPPAPSLPTPPPPPTPLFHSPKNDVSFSLLRICLGLFDFPPHNSRQCSTIGSFTCSVLIAQGRALPRPKPLPMTVTDGVCLFVGCLTSQQHASISPGRICSDNFTCCHAETEVADQTFYLTRSRYTDTRPTSPSTDPITPGAWQGSHWNANA